MKRLWAALSLTFLVTSVWAQSPVPPPVDRIDAVLDIVEKHYIHRIERQELEEQALRAFLQNLDPYSHYYNAEEWALFEEDLSGTFGGVGVGLGYDEKAKLPFIKYLMHYGSAGEAGVQRGDRITEIDGWSTKGSTLDDIISRLRGRAGTKVNLLFHREGSQERIARLLERRVLKLPSVRGVRRAANGAPDYMLDEVNRIGYIHIQRVLGDTAHLVEEALGQLQRREMKGLVLDLRDNAGGMLKVAVAVADLLLDEGNIVTVVGTDKKVHDATKGVATAVPIVMLINDQTASAGEIIAGALVDNRRVTAVGQRTWGKGRVPVKFKLPEGLGGVVLTTATFQRPNGQTFDRHDADRKEKAGIAPDPTMELALTEEELHAWRDEVGRFDGVPMLTEEEQIWKAEDRVLARGLEVLRKLIQ
jgi:carboxyl-terminal processing protease